MIIQMQQQLQRVEQPRLPTQPTLQKKQQPQQKVQQQQTQVVQQQPVQMVQQQPGQLVQQQPGWALQLQQMGGNSQAAGFGALQQQLPLQQPALQQLPLQQPAIHQPVLQQPGLQQMWYNGQQGEAMDQGWSGAQFPQ